MSDRVKDILNSINQTLQKAKSECEPDDSPEECEKEKLEAGNSPESSNYKERLKNSNSQG